MKTENKKTNIPEGWKMTTLGDIAEEITYGYTESAKKEKIGPKFLRITDIQDDFIDWKSVPYCFISEKDYFKYKLEIGDIVIARTGNSTGAISTIKEEVNAVFASYLIRFKINQEKADYKFIDLLLRSEIWKNFVKSIKGGSAQGGANAKNFAEFSILLPILPEQQAIAAVLSSLDDKIELLREQNKTLEAIAQAIYKRWFVDFEFPIEDETSKLPSLKGGEPEGRGGFDNALQLKGYKSRGGKMVESELGEIPEGWEVGKIKDLIDILPGFAFSSTDFSQEGQYKLVTIKNVQDRYFNPQTKDNLKKLPKKMPDYCILESGDILISLTGNVGRICLANGKDYLLNQRVAKLRAKNENDHAFTYLLFLQDSIFLLMQNTASGTAQQNLSPIQLKEINIIIADRKILDKFGIVTNKLIQKIKNNISQIQTLSRLRDSLLPKLMSGKIRVPTTPSAGGCHPSLTEGELKSENPQTEGE